MYIEALMCACVPCVQEERTTTHGLRGRLLAKNNHGASFTTKARNTTFDIRQQDFKHETENVMSLTSSQADF